MVFVEEGVLVVMLAVLGLAFGSFLNVLVLRLNTGETFRGRSKCFSCLEKLRWYDLIPLLSFAAVWGRCRYCKTRISVQYPIVELLSAVVVVLVGLLVDPFSMPARFLVTSAFFLTLLAIAVYDVRHTIVPDELAFGLAFFALLFEGLNVQRGADIVSVAKDFLPAFGAFAFFGLIWLLSRGMWMGFGDAKIAFSLGLFLGYPGILFALYFAFWAGAIVAIALMMFAGASRKSEIPFVPFLALGSFSAFLVLATDLFLKLRSYVQIV